MDIAIVTGAETPLGLRLIKSLIRQGCRVHGIGNNFSKVTFADPYFIAHAIDLSDLNAVTEATGKILEAEQRLDILIHAIDVTPGAAFEKLPVGNLEAVLKIGLLGPVMMTRLVLPNLLRFRGQLINIIPGNKSGQPASAANALIEGGLRQMNLALFDQARDAGLRVTNLILRQNTAAPTDASPEIVHQSRIDPEHVARVVERLIDAYDPNVPNEISLYPRLSPEAESALPTSAVPVDPYSAVVLPPKEYCPPEEPKIPTREKEKIDRIIPYTDEEMEDKIAAAIEDFEAHPERYEAQAPKPQKQKQPQQEKAAKPSDPNQNEPDSNDNDEGGASNKSRRRRGRRRGGRNRNKHRSDQDGSSNQGQPSSKDTHSPTQGSNNQQPQKQPTNPTQTPSSDKASPAGESQGKSNKRPARNRRRGAKSNSEQNGSKPLAEGSQKPKQAPQDPVSSRTEPKLEDKAPAKKAAKKATKKAAKKAVKKTATKKAVKKAAKKAVKKKAKPAED